MIHCTLEGSKIIISTDTLNIVFPLANCVDPGEMLHIMQHLSLSKYKGLKLSCYISLCLLVPSPDNTHLDQVRQNFLSKIDRSM